MPEYEPDMKPQLRPVEAKPVEMDGQMGFAIGDPTGMAATTITVSQAALFVLSKFDGRHTLDAVREDFETHFDQPIAAQTLADMVDGLRQARLLAGEEFDSYYASLLAQYRAAPVRSMRSAGDLGLDEDAAETIQNIVDASPTPVVSGKVTGIVAPHLDYARGEPCYSVAYSMLVNRPAPARVVILGTNHFGQSTSAVVTGKDFATPLGTTPADIAFIERLETRCSDLRAGEMDHQREHSIELQLLFCQHLWGAEAFGIVPVLCPDPCGPTGTAPIDGVGVDLRDFAETLGEAIRDDPGETLVIAGADMSHVGAFFGDERELDNAFLAEVRDRDSAVLDMLRANDAEGFRRQVAGDGNPTHICSAGCIFVAMTAMSQAKVTVLRYHQAVVQSAQNGVTCAAAVFSE